MQEYPHLEQLFGAYFHQDWTEEGEDWPDIVRLYLDDSGTGVAAPTGAELRRLLDEHPSDDVLETLLDTTFGCCYMPRPDLGGPTVRGWLRELCRMLEAEVEAEIWREPVETFFDAFVEAFRTFDGAHIAERYQAPYLAAHVDAPADCFAEHTEIGLYFQRVVDDYHAQGCRSCRYHELEYFPMGKAAVVATVTWELLDASGKVVTAWRESYNLAHDGKALKVFCSVDHAS
jgi:hypothetical protein